MWKWLKKPAKASPNDQKSSSMGSIIAMNQVGQPVWTPRRYESLAEEGYQKNVVVYRAVNLIARGAASVPWRLYRGDEELLQHPLLDLLQYPNTCQAGSSLIESVLAYLLLAGNSYLEIARNFDGKPAELHVLRPDRIKVVPGANGLPQAYEYTVGNRRRLLKGDTLSREGDVLHL
ncbi:MAG: phage portal protein [Janthinobacterium lividum]